jgi:hypothetical protein
MKCCIKQSSDEEQQAIIIIYDNTVKKDMIPASFETYAASEI